MNVRRGSFLAAFFYPQIPQITQIRQLGSDVVIVYDLDFQRPTLFLRNLWILFSLATKKGGGTC
jgi:hypothetical protein